MGDTTWSNFACEVKSSFWLSSGFWSWCGVKWEVSKPDKGKAPPCPACLAAMAAAGKKP